MNSRPTARLCYTRNNSPAGDAESPAPLGTERLLMGWRQGNPAKHTQWSGMASAVEICGVFPLNWPCPGFLPNEELGGVAPALTNPRHQPTPPQKKASSHLRVRAIRASWEMTD